MLRGATTYVTIRFQPKGLEPGEKSMLFHIFANTTSKLVGKEPPQRDLLVKVVRQAKLNFRGWPKPEQSFYSGSTTKKGSSQGTTSGAGSSESDISSSSPMEMEDVGSQVSHSFTVFNDGPSTAPKVQIVIYWPWALDSDPQSNRQDLYLLYLEQIPTVEVGLGECHVAPEYVNPLGLTTGSREAQGYLSAPAQMRMYPSAGGRRHNKSMVQHTQRSYYSSSSSSNDEEEDQEESSQRSHQNPNRVKRSFLERVTRLERLMYDPEGGSSNSAGSSNSGKKQDIVELDCNKGGARCVRIECEIWNMPARSEAQVVVTARLWNSTLVNEYPRVDRVRIISSATARIPDDYGVEVMELTDCEVGFMSIRDYFLY